MIRTAEKNDVKILAALYNESIYGKTPSLVSWALRTVPERILVVERNRKIVGAAYTDVCDYNNLWSSYFVFKDVSDAKDIIDHLMKMREEKGHRNFYVFHPKECAELRVELIIRGFLPECLRKLDRMDYVIESYDSSFKPDYKITPPQKRKLRVKIRKGRKEDVKPLATILHKSLPTDFEKLQNAKNCVKYWLKEPKYMIVAEYNECPIGVLLLSSEIGPVTDKKVGMLCYIAVDEKYRRGGVGTALIEEACGILRQDGKSNIEVDVNMRNIGARIFYARNGFYPFWYSRGYMPHNDGIFHRKDFNSI